MRTFSLTLLALFAFAANSVLCRLALAGSAIDAASFTTVRIAAGGVVLWLLILTLDKGKSDRKTGSFGRSLMLFLYAATFSFAYLELPTGIGALILFGAVQGTMVLAGLWQGERLSRRQWTGYLVAAAGLVWLLGPGITAPSPPGALLMALAGCAWGGYSLLGRNAQAPLANTAGNFLRALPPALLLSLLLAGRFHVTPYGLLLAAVSGGVASGCGYVVWYAALRELTAVRAATVQLAVPVLAALGGTVFLAEPVTARMLGAALLILGGIGVAMRAGGKTED